MNTKVISWGVLFIVCVSAVLFLWGYITSIQVNYELDFEFVGNMVTAYTGDETDVSIPTTYSINGTRNVKQSQVFETQEVATTYLNANFTEGTDEYNGFKYQLENNAFPWTYVYYQKKNIFVEGADYQVYSIGSNCFKNNKTIKSVTIPNQITTIGSYAFSGCSMLTDVQMPANLRYINSYAFQSCARLYNFTLPETLLEINAYAFDNCDMIRQITIPKNVNYIGRCCFRGCANLRTMTIQNTNQVITTPSSTGLYSWNLFRMFYNTSIQTIYISNSIYSNYLNTNYGWRFYTSYFVGV